MNVYEYRPNDEKVAAMLLVAVVCLVGAFSVGYMLGVRNVHDDGSGNASIGQQIGQAESNIGNAASGIEAAAGHAEQVASGIESAKESANYIHGTAKTSEGIIGECKQILAGIRQRGKTETSTH